MSEQCAECGNPFRSQLFWNSYVTNEMVQDLNDDEKDYLFQALNDAVMVVCSDWNVQ